MTDLQPDPRNQSKTVAPIWQKGYTLCSRLTVSKGRGLGSGSRVEKRGPRGPPVTCFLTDPASPEDAAFAPRGFGRGGAQPGPRLPDLFFATLNSGLEDPDRGPKEAGLSPTAGTGPPTMCDPGQCSPLSELWFLPPSQGCYCSQQEEVEGTEPSK